jgi:hypothetical protein
MNICERLGEKGQGPFLYSSREGGGLTGTSHPPEVQTALPTLQGDELPSLVLRTEDAFLSLHESSRVLGDAALLGG